MSDADLTIRLLRKLDAKFDALATRIDGHDSRFDGLEAKLGAFRDYCEMRFSVIEHTLNMLAGQMHAFSQFMRTIDARVRKLEGRPAK